MLWYRISCCCQIARAGSLFGPSDAFVKRWLREKPEKVLKSGLDRSVLYLVPLNKEYASLKELDILEQTPDVSALGLPLITFLASRQPYLCLVVKVASSNTSYRYKVRMTDQPTQALSMSHLADPM